MKTEQANMDPHKPIPIDEIYAAQERLAGSIFRTPLIRLNVDDAPAEIYLKLECLQPIGSFKLRGAGNAIALASKEQLSKGVYTSSAGNMAQGVAWNAQRLGLPCTIVVPKEAPETKLSAIRRLGATYIKVPYDEWWEVMSTHHYEPLEDGLFIHPSSNPNVMAGNGTIGLEILEDLPDVDAVLIPFGSGGLSSGIGCAIRALKPDTKIYACEVETAAPVAPSLAAGSPQVIDFIPSFVDGMGAKSILPEMWPLVSQNLDGALVVSLEQIADAICLLIERNRVVAEGAGAGPVAAALTGQAVGDKIVCVVSGGNIDSAKLATILQGGVP
jgi:threonine dehydratase